MAQDATKIMAGPARIFVGVTAGTSGAPPTLITHTDGVPGSGDEVGFTEGDAIFSYQAIKEEIEAEQSLAAVDVFVTGEMASITFTAQEHVVAALKRAFDNTGFDSTAGRELFYMGGGTSVLAPRKECVVLTARQRLAPTKFLVAVLYRAYSPDGFKMSFGKKTKGVYPVTLKGLADVTRTANDQLGYYAVEK